MTQIYVTKSPSPYSIFRKPHSEHMHIEELSDDTQKLIDFLRLNKIFVSSIVVNHEGAPLCFTTEYDPKRSKGKIKKLIEAKTNLSVVISGHRFFLKAKDMDQRTNQDTNGVLPKTTNGALLRNKVLAMHSGTSPNVAGKLRKFFASHGVTVSDVSTSKNGEVLGVRTIRKDDQADLTLQRVLEKPGQISVTLMHDEDYSYFFFFSLSAKD